VTPSKHTAPITETGHIAELFPDRMTKDKFTYQLSDPLPLWMQIRTDIDGHELEQIVRG
jgi:hypothetical protein